MGNALLNSMEDAMLDSVADSDLSSYISRHFRDQLSSPGPSDIDTSPCDTRRAHLGDRLSSATTLSKLSDTDTSRCETCRARLTRKQLPERKARRFSPAPLLNPRNRADSPRSHPLRRSPSYSLTERNLEQFDSEIQPCEDQKLMLMERCHTWVEGVKMLPRQVPRLDDIEGIYDADDEGDGVS